MVSAAGLVASRHCGEHLHRVPQGNFGDGVLWRHQFRTRVTLELMAVVVARASLYIAMAAHFSFLDPDHPDELLEENLLIRLLQGLTDPMMHIPCGFITDAEHPFHFLGRDSPLRGIHEVEDQQPVGQRPVGVVEDGTHGRAELTATI
jgi:hypothetical protein